MFRPFSTQEKFPRIQNFPNISLLNVENFQLQNFFSDRKFVSSANHILQSFLYICYGKFIYKVKNSLIIHEENTKEMNV